MKILLSSRRHDYIVVVSIFLITAALIVGMVGCVGEGGGGGGIEYNLTIDSNSGGTVTTPGEGTFVYDEGTPVLLMTVADGGYQFINWVGDVSTVANVDAATTTITMSGDYSITASFAEITPMVAAGYRHTVGLESDGSVVAVGATAYGQCNISSWAGRVQVAAGDYHTVGLRSNGSVGAVGQNDYGQCDVGS